MYNISIAGHKEVPKEDNISVVKIDVRHCQTAFITVQINTPACPGIYTEPLSASPPPAVTSRSGCGSLSLIGDLSHWY